MRKTKAPSLRQTAHRPPAMCRTVLIQAFETTRCAIALSCERGLVCEGQRTWASDKRFPRPRERSPECILNCKVPISIWNACCNTQLSPVAANQHDTCRTQPSPSELKPLPSGEARAAGLLPSAPESHRSHRSHEVKAHSQQFTWGLIKLGGKTMKKCVPPKETSWPWSFGCGSTLNDRRGKPQALVHVSTYQGSILVPGQLAIEDPINMQRHDCLPACTKNNRRIQTFHLVLACLIHWKNCAFWHPHPPPTNTPTYEQLQQAPNHLRRNRF